MYRLYFKNNADYFEGLSRHMPSYHTSGVSGNLEKGLDLPFPGSFRNIDLEEALRFLVSTNPMVFLRLFSYERLDVRF